jgi:hypothetical protein
MIGANDKAPIGAGQRKLGDHALTGLDVSEQEILPRRITNFQAARSERGQHGIGRGLDIDREEVVRADGVQGALRVAFIRLSTIRQTYGDEAYLVTLIAQAIDGALRQKGRCQGIHAAADAQEIGLQARRLEIDREELHATACLGLRLEVGMNAQSLDDQVLFSHELVSKL